MQIKKVEEDLSLGSKSFGTVSQVQERDYRTGERGGMLG